MGTTVTELRIESDFLGSKEVPAAAYYGIQTMRAVENFPITGNKLHPELIRALAIVKKASALANMEVELLAFSLGEAIVQAAEEIIDGKLHDQFIVDPIQGGAGTSMNMNANEVIANRALEILGKKRGNTPSSAPIHMLICPNQRMTRFRPPYMLPCCVYWTNYCAQWRRCGTFLSTSKKSSTT